MSNSVTFILDNYPSVFVHTADGRQTTVIVQWEMKQLQLFAFVITRHRSLTIQALIYRV